jgi:hypothetical protein
LAIINGGLSPDKLAAKRTNGECYYYLEKFSNDHKCKTKGLFLLELDDDTAAKAVTKDLRISLHALTSIDIADTMKLHVQVNDKTPVVLVDIGSTHTFMNAAVVNHLGLPATPRPGLSIKVANGERVASPGIYAATDMLIDDEHFSTNLYVLPLDDFDVILGV